MHKCHRCTSFVFFPGGFLEKEHMEIHEFLGSGKGQLIPETALRYLCTPALPCLGDVKAPPLLKPGVSWWNRRFKQVEKNQREHRKWLRIIQFLIVFGLVLMLIGGKKLKWEVFTGFSFISASIFPFQNSVGAMRWGDVVDFCWWEMVSDVERNEAKLPLMVSIIMGLQHSLAMLGGIITPPSLIAGLKEKYHCLLADAKFFCSRFHGFLLRSSCSLALWKFQHLTLRNCWKTKKWNSFTGSFSRSTDMSYCLGALSTFLHSVLKSRLQEMLAFPILKKNFANPGSDSLGWKPDVEMCRLCGWVSQVPLNHNILGCRANSDFETVFPPLGNAPYRL